jgi:2-dehydro-3-deoxyphosphogluconate aldolase/(4S)-4-hydroxy-2-oxoglutarate aldolase
MRGIMTITERIAALGIVPVVSIQKPEHAIPLAEALLAGGLPCAEITFRTAAAAESIKLIRQHVPDLLVGAGTVLSTEQADIALSNGAEFIVAPGTNPAVVAHCVKRGVPIYPGVCTPSEIEMALSHGAEVLKFFPAEPAGGVNFLKAVCAPYHHVRFMPTGGIDLNNLGNYLALKQVVACGGSWMVKPELIKAGAFDQIEQLAREAVATVRKLRLAV